MPIIEVSGKTSRPDTDNMDTINYSHENIVEESRIWPSRHGYGHFCWANRNGEGECDTFEEAVREAEEALIFGDALRMLNEQSEMVQDAFVGEVAEDGQTTLEVHLWRGYSMQDLNMVVNPLEVRAEGNGEYGRVYSLTMPTSAN